jgi:NADPH-dependent 2,4-dienoyl-CoA reductase/sulfur reductase-like enzyme
VVDRDRYSPYERPPLSKRVVPGTTPSLTPLIDDQKLCELDVELIRGTGVRALDLVRHRVELDDGQMLMADAVLLADLDVLSPKNPGSARCLWPRRVRATGR